MYKSKKGLSPGIDEMNSKLTGQKFSTKVETDAKGKILTGYLSKNSKLSGQNISHNVEIEKRRIYIGFQSIDFLAHWSKMSHFQNRKMGES